MAKQSSSLNKEHNNLMAILNFRLPHIYKKIGLVSAVLIFAFILAHKFLGISNPIFVDFLRSVLLLFLLMASLSNDKFEDEYNKHLRYQSYIISMVLIAGYAVIIPIIASVLDFLITTVSGNGSLSFYEISSFEVLFSILAIQILFFETLKRFVNAE